MRWPVTALLLAMARGVSSQTPSTSADSTHVVTPKTPNEATALGIKLLGVFDAQTGEWMDRVIVRDTLGNETRTSQTGVAALNVLSEVAGYYMLEIRTEGYAPAYLRLRQDSTSEFLVALRARPLGQSTTLPTVVTTAKASLRSDAGLAAGFVNRCELGARCVGRRELDLRPTEQLADLLSRVDGIHRTCSGSTSIGPDPNATWDKQLRTSAPLIANSLTNSPTCTVEMEQSPVTNVAHPWCVPTYFVNGLPWHPDAESGGAQMQIDSFLDPSRMLGIEVYPTNQAMPLRYLVPGSVCGAIVIWTRNEKPARP